MGLESVSASEDVIGDLRTMMYKFNRLVPVSNTGGRANSRAEAGGLTLAGRVGGRADGRVFAQVSFSLTSYDTLAWLL